MGILVSKIYTSLLNTRLSNWGNLRDKVTETRADFRHGYSAMDNVFTLNAMFNHV